MNHNPIDVSMMSRALELAQRGLGSVEPNPMVGCVIALDDQIVGEGWHQHFGQPHAEVNAIADANCDLQGATLYVTLEPCCHQGKTPPCTQAILTAGIHRVVIAQPDPFPQVDGRGIELLRAAGVEVEIGVGAEEGRWILAPFRKLVEHKRPWIVAKWAMTLDGKLATRSRNSQWISNPASREIVHQLRGRVDAIMVGSGTASADDPLLTARPPGPRQAARVVVDSLGSLSLQSQLVQTAGEIPVLVAVGAEIDRLRSESLIKAGVELIQCPGNDHLQRLDHLLTQLGARQMTNVFVEGGGQLLGNLFELDQIDEVHVFVAPKLAGGEQAVSPIEGNGIELMEQARQLEGLKVERVGDDVYLQGRIIHRK